jgi:hypothetical protein
MAEGEKGKKNGNMKKGKKNRRDRRGVLGQLMAG